MPAPAQTATPAAAAAATLASVLAARTAALKALHVRAPQSLQVMGTIEGAGLGGRFHSWSSPRGQRYDQTIGTRLQSTYRTAGGRLFAVDENANVREMRGLMLQRQITGDFIDQEGFAAAPQFDTFNGPLKLADGRQAYAIEVQPKGGLPEEIDLDAKTWMIDRISYDESDGISSADFYDYKTYQGALVALREIDSNGDRPFDLTRTAVRIVVDGSIPPAVFDVPKNNEIVTDVPVTVPLADHQGHYYTKVSIHGHPYTFLVDTGAQAIVLDTHVAKDLGLVPEGKLEVYGAQRIGGLGIAALDAMQIGSATLPLKSVSVLDLRNVTGNTFEADGVLGYPFFASAEVQVDAANHTMTFGRPGSLHAAGSTIPIDVDRELIEMQGRVNGVRGRFVLDTGNSGELLLFAPFMRAHPNLLPPQDHAFANSFGVGGAAQAMSAFVDELDMSDFRFFNRYSNLMLSSQGAFADRFDAGNIGMGVLRNLVVTFDVANAHAYASQSNAFDDGRYRSRPETSTFPK
ncbi:MAG: aspartyl protease family protein [Candidatus Baltobacteraceae bacterium]